MDDCHLYLTLGQTRRNFGNTLENCLKPVTRPRNFCDPRKLKNRNAPNSFVRYRTITGICNNLQPGMATVGASGIVTARFFKRKRNLFFFIMVLVIYFRFCVLDNVLRIILNSGLGIFSNLPILHKK